MRIIPDEDDRGRPYGGDDDKLVQVPLITSEEDDRDMEAAPTQLVATQIADLEMEMEESNGVCWAELTLDMLAKILGHSGSSVDCRTLRSVCSQWHRSIPRPITMLSSYLPVGIPSVSNSNQDQRELSHSLANCVYAATSVCLARAPAESDGIFFLFVGEFVRGKLWLQNPLSKSLVSEMPCYLPPFLNLLDFDVVEVANYGSLGFVPFNYKSLPPFKLDREIIKVVMFSNFWAIMALTTTGDLLLLKFGQVLWQVLNLFSLKFDDMVDFEGKVFAVSRKGLVCAIECDGTAKLLEVTVPRYGLRRKRLVRSSNDLYLIVTSAPPISRSLKVYMLSLDIPLWVNVPSIGDTMFFVGYESSFSVSTQGPIGRLCKRGTIIYTDESFPFHMEMDQDPRPKAEKDVLELSSLNLESTSTGWRGRETPSPDYTSMFWPPPIWLLSNAM